MPKPIQPTHDVPLSPQRGRGDSYAVSPAASDDISRSVSDRSIVVAGPSSYPALAAGTLPHRGGTAASVDEELRRHGPDCGATVTWPDQIDRLVRHLSSAGEWYTRKVPARFPCCCATIGCIIVGVLIGVGMFFYPLDIDTDFDSFMKTDAETSVWRDAFLAAHGSRVQKGGRRLQGYQLYKHFNLFVTYEWKESAGSVGVLDQSVLSQVNRFEQELVALPEWRQQCDDIDKRLQGLCRPGLSLPSHVFPGADRPADTDIVPTQLNFDGTGSDALPLPTVLAILENKKMVDVVFPKGFNRSALEATKVVRSAFQFKMRCCRSAESTAEQGRKNKALSAKWKEFMIGSVLKKLQSAAEDESLPFHVFFDGKDLKDIEIMEALSGDIRLATFSMGFVLMYVIFHTGSIFLSMAGLIIIVLAVPLSYVVFQLLARSTAMSVASFLALFLVVGLGSDVIFVFTDLWRDSAHIKENHAQRLSWTLFHAGKASLATSMTTALSFFANLVSVLRPLREFGVFMGLCVIFVWLLVVILYAPLLIVDDYWFGAYSLDRCLQKVKGQLRPAGINSLRSSLLAAWTRQLQPLRRLFVAGFVVLVLIAVIPAGMMVEVDTGLPDIFPADHNRVRGTEVFENFESLEDIFDASYQLPPLKSDVCSEASFKSSDVACLLFWCEAPHSPEHRRYIKAPEGTCQCLRKEKPDDCKKVTAATALVETRVVGLDTLSTAQLTGPIATSIDAAKGSGLTFSSFRRGSMTTQSLADLVVQDWATGAVSYTPMTHVTTTLDRVDGASSPCGWQQLCFCGTSTCNPADGWQVGASFQMAERRLASPLVQRVAPNAQASVDVVFGIKVKGKAPLFGEVAEEDQWGFLNDFDISHPWAQRNLYTFCSQMPQDLRVVENKMSCWMIDFHKWLKRRSDRFPVPKTKFKEMLELFLDTGTTGNVESKEFMWLRKGVMKACYVEVIVDFNRRSNMNVAAEYKEKWDDYLKSWNAKASKYSKGAWHSSTVWVRTEAQRELISSTAMTLILVVSLAFIGMLVFTLDPMLSFYVVIATVGVICGLAFFIVVVMRWEIGPVEVIALIVFIGYAVTYSLHIAHKYSSNQGPLTEPLPLDMDPLAAIRFQRTIYAMKSIGGAALGSAMTTIGCSIFLLFCTLTIFQKLGGVVLAVTIMSIFTALGPLPSILLMVGPLRPGWMVSACLQGAVALARLMHSLICPKRGKDDTFNDGASSGVVATREAPTSHETERRDQNIAISVQGVDISEDHRPSRESL